jgi:hypothetical protein
MEPGPSAARAKERKRGIELNITLLFFVYHGLMKESNAGLSIYIFSFFSGSPFACNTREDEKVGNKATSTFHC